MGKVRRLSVSRAWPRGLVHCFHALAVRLDLLPHLLRISSGKLARASEQCGAARVDSTPDSGPEASGRRNERNRWKFVQAVASKKRWPETVCNLLCTRTDISSCLSHFSQLVGGFSPSRKGETKGRKNLLNRRRRNALRINTPWEASHFLLTDPWKGIWAAHLRGPRWVVRSASWRAIASPLHCRSAWSGCGRSRGTTPEYRSSGPCREEAGLVGIHASGYD